MQKGLVNLILLLILIGSFALVYWLKKGSDVPVITHSVIVEKVQAMGKMELVKYQIKDIIDFRKRREYLPDSKVLLIVSGEIIGCIDLTGLSKNNITNSGENEINVVLPLPEICSVKVDHQNSKVYDVTSLLFVDNEAEMIDQSYKEAEKYLKNPRLTSKVLDECRKNAEIMLKPILETISGKNVTLSFKSL